MSRHRTNPKRRDFMKTVFERLAGVLLAFLILGTSAFGQTTEFTYQGKLNDAGGQASTYDFEFRLCSTESGTCTTPIATVVKTGVAVSAAGIFTINLDFGASNLDGANRFIEIGVRRAGTPEFTTLAPRQKLTSVPYAVQALNTETFGNLGVSDFVQDNDPRIQPNNYVQNTTTAQANVNFNIGGTGGANVFNATTQFDLAGERILGGAAGTDNLFAGRNSGAANAGLSNSFFGTNSGRLNIASNNSFFGAFSGEINTSGASNAFFGGGSGTSNTTGRVNSFFGSSAGSTNSQGNFNSFFGGQSGVLNSTGTNNTFLGYNAGATNSTGSRNTLVGVNSNVGANNLTMATALGADAYVTQSNSLVLGSINGVNGSSSDTRVGIGTTAPSFKLEIVDPSNTGLRVRTNTVGGTVGSFGGNGQFQVDSTNLAGGRFSILENGRVGIGNAVPLYSLDVIGQSNDGFRIRNATSGGRIASFGGTGVFNIDSPTVAGGRLTVLENGNVGIGDAAPDAKLSVAGTGTNSTALEISSGAIKVAGAGVGTFTPVLIVERRSGNSCGDGNLLTVVDSPFSNNDPNAILFVTTVLAGYTPIETTPVTLYYAVNDINCPQFNNKWVIKMAYGGNLQPVRFNVMIIKR